METKKRFRPSLRQYRILEAANKELMNCKTGWINENLKLRHDLCHEANMRLDQLETSVYYKNKSKRHISLNWYLLALIVAQGILLIVR